MSELLIGGLDLETSGLSQEKGHRVIEIALVLFKLDTATMEVTRRGAFTQRVNPMRPVDPDAQAVHGISLEMLFECPTWETVGPKVAQLMRACNLLVAHNGNGFDAPFIGGELLRIGQALPETPWFDTMLCGTFATPLGKRPSLKELCFCFGVDYDVTKAHAALFDVEVMMECFFRGTKSGFFSIPQAEPLAA